MHITPVADGHPQNDQNIIEHLVNDSMSERTAMLG